MANAATVLAPTVFKSSKEVTIKKEAEETVSLWTPEEYYAYTVEKGAEVKKKNFFVLQGIIISLNKTATYFKFEDETTEIFGINVKAIAATEAALVLNFGPGYKSKKPGNILKLKLAAESAGVSIVVFGAEES